MPQVHPDSLLVSLRSPTYLRWQSGVHTFVLREAVTHIHRPSRATEARVVITRNQEAFSMRITDNGCGGLAARGMLEHAA